MNLEELKSMVKYGESHILEFKASTSSIRAAFATACAFLNANGGHVIIGVKENGKIVGQDISEGTRKEIVYEMNKIEPPPYEYLKIYFIPAGKQRQVIVIDVTRGSQLPYVYDGRAYQRGHSHTSKMSQERYHQLVSMRSQLNYSWEYLLSEYSVDKIDDEVLFSAVKHGIEKQQLPVTALRETAAGVLKKLKLLKEGKLLNAAVALFGKDLFPDYPQCQLKMARFSGTDRNEFLDSKIVYGNIFELLKEGDAFIRKHLPLAARIIPGQLEREETPLIPDDAVREAWINSFCHRNYGNRGGSISLGIYDDRMEIFNNGGLIHGITLKIIKEGHSEQRNPLIADVLNRTGYVEKWGRGIQEMISSCIKAGDPEPEFVVNDDISFTVIFRFPKKLKNIVFTTYSVDELAAMTNIDTKRLRQLSMRQREILAILYINNELSLKMIISQMLAPPSDRVLRQDLQQLEKLNLIASSGRTKDKVWFKLDNLNK